MSEFKKYHPIVNFLYFVFVIVFSVTEMHPVCLTISLLSSLLCTFVCCGSGRLKSSVLFFIPVFLMTALINPLFNHEGITIITYLPGGNPLTLESVVYGLCSACMIVNVICWFGVYGNIMTSDKFIYLFGWVIPSLSLIFSMTLRFIPLFAKQLKTVVNARKGMGIDSSTGSIKTRIKNGLTALSVMITWALENAIDTADSMRSRGYGIPGRTAFSVFRFSGRDIAAITAIVFLGLYVLVGSFAGAAEILYFPYLKSVPFSLYSVSVYFAYGILCLIPIFIEIWEVIKWNVSDWKK